MRVQLFGKFFDNKKDDKEHNYCKTYHPFIVIRTFFHDIKCCVTF